MVHSRPFWHKLRVYAELGQGRAFNGPQDTITVGLAPSVTAKNIPSRQDGIYADGPGFLIGRKQARSLLLKSTKLVRDGDGGWAGLLKCSACEMRVIAGNFLRPL